MLGGGVWMVVNLANMFGFGVDLRVLHWALQAAFLVGWDYLDGWLFEARKSKRRVVLWVAIAVVLVMTTSGFCLCFFNEDNGLVLGNKAVSTSFSRLLSKGQNCHPDKICHLFITLP